MASSGEEPHYIVLMGDVLNTFLIKAKTENGGKVRLGTQAFISILKHSKNCDVIKNDQINV